jgi:hypothetical protein
VASSNSSNVIVLFLAQVMGTYFCAMVILMRMNMPLEYRYVVPMQAKFGKMDAPPACMPRPHKAWMVFSRQ